MTFYLFYSLSLHLILFLPKKLLMKKLFILISWMIAFSAGLEAQPPTSCNISATFSYNDLGNGAYDFYTNYPFDPALFDISWSFGDGTFAYDSNWVNHVYSSAGYYNVNVQIQDLSDPSCWDYAETLIYVYSSAGNCNIDAGFSYYTNGNNNFCFYTNYAFDPSLYSINWSFGDGNYAYGSDWVNHVYSSSGYYYVNVQVQDLNDPNCWTYAENWVYVDTVQTQCNIDPVIIGNEIGNGQWEFNTASQYQPGDYNLTWTFGDGSTITGNEMMNHTYSGPGDYTVCLIITSLSDPSCFASTCNTYSVTNTLNPEVTGITDPADNPENKYELINMPNPFRDNTTIRFSIPENNFVKLEVFNVLGESVQILVSGQLVEGEHSYRFDAENNLPGTYFYRLTTNNYSVTKAMNLLR